VRDRRRKLREIVFKNHDEGFLKERLYRAAARVFTALHQVFKVG